MATSTRVPGSLLPDDQIKLYGKATLPTSTGATVNYTPGQEYAPPSIRHAVRTISQAPAVNAVTGNALFVGGGGGGGGGAAGGAAQPAPRKFLEDFELEEIESALAAINAQFGREGTGLENQKNAISRAFTLLSDQFGEQETRQLDLSKERAAGGGRIRSGLFLNEQADIADEFADRLTRARAEKDAQLSPIQQALATLEARREEAREQRARQIAQQRLGTREAIAQALGLV